MSKCGVRLVGPSGDRIGLVASVHSNRRPPLPDASVAPATSSTDVGSNSIRIRTAGARPAPPALMIVAGRTAEKRQERHDRHQRMERQDERADRQDHTARRERPRRERGDRVERAEREQYYAKPAGGGSGGRDKQPDPNSPFAKLAALKQQLEQANKEPS